MWQSYDDYIMDTGRGQTHHKDGATSLSPLRDKGRKARGEQIPIEDPRSLLNPHFLFFSLLGLFSETLD